MWGPEHWPQVADDSKAQENAVLWKQVPCSPWSFRQKGFCYFSAAFSNRHNFAGTLAFPCNLLHSQLKDTRYLRQPQSFQEFLGTHWTASPGGSCRPQSHRSRWSAWCCRRSGWRCCAAPHRWAWNLRARRAWESLTQQVNMLSWMWLIHGLLQLQVEGQDYSSQKVCWTPTPTSVGPFQSPLCCVKRGIEFSHGILSDCIFHIVSRHNQSYVPQINP